MSESQSRYSIVERCLQNKLDILDDKLQLAKDIEDKKQELIAKTKEFNTWEKIVQEDVAREKNVKEVDIMKLQAKIDFLEANKEARENAFDLKIAEIDKAMERIETISKTAGSE